MPALAARHDGFLIDLDGTVWVGDEMVAGAAAAVGRLQDRGKALVFVTNDSRAGTAELAERLRAGGIEAEPERVVTAARVTAGLASEACSEGGRAFVIGAAALRAEVAAAGLELLDGEAGAGADVVIVALHTGFDYAELRIATAALRGGAALFGTNREPALPMPCGPWPGTGAILAAVEYASGRTATIGGKPERHLFERARALMPGAKRVAVVGDSLRSDVAGAVAVGLEPILVLSGNTSAGEAEAAGLGHGHVLTSLADLA
jgi:HAD superfamily hydrolase (TIGR01450 family)